MRNFKCKEYNECLDKAAIAGSDFNCDGCNGKKNHKSERNKFKSIDNEILEARKRLESLKAEQKETRKRLNMTVLSEIKELLKNAANEDKARANVPDAKRDYAD